MTETMIPQRNIRSAVPVGLATVLAYLAVGAGVVYAGMALAGEAWARVPVELTAQAPAWQEVVLPCVEGWSLDGISGCAPAVQPQQWPAGESLAGPVIRLLEETPRIGAGGEFLLPSGWLAPDLSVSWWPVLVIAILACFSAATRRGTRLAADTEGLV